MTGINPDGTPKTSADGTGGNTGTNKKLAPVLRNEKIRLAGLLGPVAGLGLQAAGFGRPSTAGLEAAASMAGVQPIMADYMPIGNYLTYKPLDTDYQANKLASAAAGSRHAVLNSGSTPSRMAGILASDNKLMSSIGDAYRAADESNFKKRTEVATFNRDTDKTNAAAYNQAWLQYAKDYNDQRGYNAQMQMKAAKAKMDADAAWANSIYGNIGNLATGIAKIGEENRNHNLIARMGAQGLLGHLSPENPYDSLYVTYADAAGTGKQKGSGKKASKKAYNKNYRKGGLIY